MGAACSCGGSRAFAAMRSKTAVALRLQSMSYLRLREIVGSHLAVESATTDPQHSVVSQTVADPVHASSVAMRHLVESAAKTQMRAGGPTWQVGLQALREALLRTAPLVRHHAFAWMGYDSSHPVSGALGSTAQIVPRAGLRALGRCRAWRSRSKAAPDAGKAEDSSTKLWGYRWAVPALPPPAALRA